MPKVQTTSVKNAENRGVVIEVVCVLGAVVSVVVAVLAAGPSTGSVNPSMRS